MNTTIHGQIYSTTKNKQSNFTINSHGEVRTSTTIRRGVPCASPIDFNSKVKREMVINIETKNKK